MPVIAAFSYYFVESGGTSRTHSNSFLRELWLLGEIVNEGTRRHVSSKPPPSGTRQEEVRVERGGYNDAGIKIVIRGVWRARGEVRYEGSMARESPVRGRSKWKNSWKAWGISSEVDSDWDHC
jgi:hypothetical protein